MKNNQILAFFIAIVTLAVLTVSFIPAYSQTSNQITTNANMTLRISHPLIISLFTSQINSNDTIGILQKSFIQSNSIITYWLQSPSDFNLQHTLFPYFPNQTKAIIVPSIPDINGVISDIAPSYLTKGKDIIIYDSESWTATPRTEYDSTQQGGQSITQSIDQAANIVHSAGYLFGITPELTGPPGNDSPSLINHYQQINWKNVDYLMIQSQLVVNSNSYLQKVSQIDEFVKSQSPNTKVIINIGFSKAANFSPSDIISSLNNLQNFDGVQIMYLPIDGCVACSDNNLAQLFKGMRITGSSQSISEISSLINKTKNQTASEISALINKTKNHVIPEFGSLVSLILVLSVISIIIISAKTGLRFTSKL